MKNKFVYLLQTDRGNEIYSSMKKAKKAMEQAINEEVERGTDREDMDIKETRVNGPNVDISISKMRVF